MNSELEHEEDEYVGRDPKTIVMEAFRLIRSIHDTMTPEALVTWAPVLAHNALYAAGLGCLGGGGTTFYAEGRVFSTKMILREQLTHKEELRQRFGINFHSKVSTKHFLLHSDGGPISKYPIEVPAKVQVGGNIRNAAQMKKLEWIIVEYQHSTADDEGNEEVVEMKKNQRKEKTFRAIDFWDVMTRVCDEVYMGQYTCSQPLIISPEELAMVEFLVIHLRNPTAHVQPNLLSLISKRTALNAVKTVQDITIRLCSYSRTSVAFNVDFVKELHCLAL